MRLDFRPVRLMLFVMLACLVGPGQVLVQAGGQSVANQTASRVATPDWQLVDPAQTLVSQNLLPLIHASEVQAELGLDDKAVGELERFFRTIDGDWWRSRNLPVAGRRAKVAQLEARLLEQLAATGSPETVARLKQLELQSQAARMLLRPDVAEYLQVSSEKIAALTQLAEEVDAVVAEIGTLTQRFESTDAAQKKLAALKERENSETLSALSATQKEKLHSIIGQPFDTGAVTRIFPLAPELIVNHGWAGSPAGSLADLRGKVVILHFYAYECINCQRNLPRYNEWANQFRNDDVVLVGIQTPELASERDPENIRKAAEEAGIEYPVLLDLDSENWNAWSNTMWPTVYLIDRKGYIRTWWQGELNWQGATGDKSMAEAVKKLLEEK